MTKLDPRALRDAFGTFMTGVTVVTAKDSAGKPIGFTANSFTSVSLEPPLVLVCLANSSSNYDTLINADGFAVNVLAQNQSELSNTFARPSDDRFDGVAWQHGPLGAPVFEGVSAWFDCKTHKTVEAGDHVILIGEVGGFASAPEPGLGYVRGAYVTAESEAQALQSDLNLVVSAVIIHEGRVLLVDDGRGGVTLPETEVQQQGATAALRGLIDKTGAQAAPGFIYSVFEDVPRKRQHISFLCHARDANQTVGAFVPLTQVGLDDVSDPSILTMLQRLASESQIGTYGIYYGDHASGEVRPFTKEG